MPLNEQNLFSPPWIPQPPRTPKPPGETRPYLPQVPTQEMLDAYYEDWSALVAEAYGQYNDARNVDRNWITKYAITAYTTMAGITATLNRLLANVEPLAHVGIETDITDMAIWGVGYGTEGLISLWNSAGEDTAAEWAKEAYDPVDFIRYAQSPPQRQIAETIVGAAIAALAGRVGLPTKVAVPGAAGAGAISASDIPDLRDMVREQLHGRADLPNVETLPEVPDLGGKVEDVLDLVAYRPEMLYNPLAAYFPYGRRRRWYNPT